jgi:hypothetical protein
LRLLAESIDPDHPETVALDIFDRLRLREPFAKAFSTLGIDGEAGWRVAARIKVVLLTGAGIGQEAEPILKPPPVSAAGALPAAEVLDALKGHDFSRAVSGAELTSALAAEGSFSANSSASMPFPAPPLSPEVSASPIPAKVQPGATHDQATPPTAQPIIPPALWSDPDVRWLTGIHTAEGHDYLLRESYEELLWWLLLPRLLRVAAEPTPARAAVAQMVGAINEALANAEAAGYRLDVLLAPAPAPTPDPDPDAETPVEEEVPDPPPIEIESTEAVPEPPPTVEPHELEIEPDQLPDEQDQPSTEPPDTPSKL